MKLINADKVIEKLKEHKSLFCKNRYEFRALSDKDKARVDEIDTCIAELVNAEEVPHAQLGTDLAEVGTDCISRQQAIKTVGWYSCHSGDELLFADNALRQLPPIQPKRGKWIIKDDTERFIAQCNCCRYIEDSRRIKNFCPNCGADMRGEQDG